MDEKPKSIWKKSWAGWGWLWAWLILAVATFLIVLIIGLLTPGGSRNLGVTVGSSAAISAVAVVFIGLLAFIHWLRSWTNFRRFLFACACFITLIALAYAEEDWRGWHAWNQFKHEWEAKGEKFDLKDFVPPPVPDEQNFALTPIWVESIKATLGPKNSRRWFGDRFPDNGRTNFTDRLELNMMRKEVWGWKDEPTNGNWAKGTITDLKPWQAYYRAPVETNRTSAIATNEFPITPQPQSPAEDVLLALSKFDPAIEELRQAGQLPYSRFPLEYTNESPASILLPHLATLKRCSQVLELNAIAELQNGQSEKALADVKLSLYLANSIRTEPFLISHLVRIAMLQLALQPIYEGLAEHQWSDEQLVAFGAELSKLDFLPDYKLSMGGELGMQGGEMDRLRHHPEELQSLGGYYDEENGHWSNLALPGGLIARLIPAGWFYQNQFRCARMMMEYYIPVADVTRCVFSPALASRSDAILTAEIKSASPFNMLEKLMLPALGNVARKFAWGQASVDLARVAVALERYRLARGEYPASLDALAPQFIAKVPHDVIGGGPLHYRLTSDGQFVLYSVGWNERNDGGVVVTKPVGMNSNGTPIWDISQGDWVWRYPAKME